MRRVAVVFAVLVSACAPDAGATSTSETPPTTTMPLPVTTSSAVANPNPTSTSTAGSPVTTTTLVPLETLAYQEIALLPFPVQLTALPGSAISYIATKDGRVWSYDGSLADDPALDIRAQVRNRGEQGLLSIALHPTDETRFFAHYTANNGDTVVAEFSFIDPLTIDPESERVLLRLSQPASNHNGGMIQFGPDRQTLYVGLGDGGGANDKFGNGQNQDSLLGGVVAIDVDGGADPFLFAYGLRNPWRFWIDGTTIYVADVGQNLYEEVTVTSFAPDDNFGWPITEGVHCFSPKSGCDTEGLVLPQIEVAHGDGGSCSITGGIVYRGQAIPELDGVYFYSDWCGGYLRSFRYVDGAITEETDWTSEVGIVGRVSGFGIDGEGEMYVTTAEALYKVVPVRG